MSHQDMRQIIITTHALERMNERFPEAGGERTVIADVIQALEANRYSKRQPKWAATYVTKREFGSIRYVWPADKTRCYVVAQHRVVSRKQVLKVVTVLPVADPALLERRIVLRESIGMAKAAKKKRTIRGREQ